MFGRMNAIVLGILGGMTGWIRVKRPMSLDAQEEACRRYAAEAGYVVVAVVHEYARVRRDKAARDDNDESVLACKEMKFGGSRMSEQVEASIAGVYARSSAHDDNQSRSSLDSQVAACLTFARNEGFRVSGEHIWRDVGSGRRTDRPGLSAMLAAVERGDVDVLVVLSPDRLFRGVFALLRFMEEIEKAEVVVRFVRGFQSEVLDAAKFLKEGRASMERALRSHRQSMGRRARERDSLLEDRTEE